MENFKKTTNKYFDVLRDRSKTSRVYKPHQMTGLDLAELLNDPEHKSLYMRLAKFYDNQELIRIAKSLTERKDIRNKGAYFMKVLKAADLQRKDGK